MRSAAAMVLGGFWIPQADALYAVVSTAGLLLIVWLTLRSR